MPRPRIRPELIHELLNSKCNYPDCICGRRYVAFAQLVDKWTDEEWIEMRLPIAALLSCMAKNANAEMSAYAKEQLLSWAFADLLEGDRQWSN